MHGDFTWVELMTTDTEAAAAFYCAAIGWTAAPAGPAHPDYTMFRAGPVAVVGLHPLPQPLQHQGVPPHWGGHIAVDDVDAMAARVQQQGGTIRRPPDDIPEVGRFAVVADPQGAGFSLFRPNPGQPMPGPAGATPGHVGWYELHAADWTAAFGFYAGLFGWTKTMEVDMGAMGTYQTFATPGTPPGGMAGGMMNKADAMPRPGWSFYFNVDTIDAAVDRVRAAGGAVLHEPMQVPGGSWIAQCRDPQGAMFAMLGPRA